VVCVVPSPAGRGVLHDKIVSNIQEVRARGARTIVIAEDGDEAVGLAERLQPDLVLMDIEMPRLDGVAATREIRERCPGARVVMLTGRRERSDELDSEYAGAIGFLRKDELASPHLADSLLALVRLS
jgi:CheY-like chemotaxis protein